MHSQLRPDHPQTPIEGMSNRTDPASAGNQRGRAPLGAACIGKWAIVLLASWFPKKRVRKTPQHHWGPKRARIACFRPLEIGGFEP